MYYNQDEIAIYLRDVRKEKRLTREEEFDLAYRIQSGDKKAEELLVRANLLFVISIAKQYQNCGMVLVDLISEGNYGLVKAAQRYKVESGNKFISYAVWWIRQSILQCLNENARIIRLPVNLTNELIKLRKLTGVDLETPQISYPKAVTIENTFDATGENMIETFRDDVEYQPDYGIVSTQLPLKDALEAAMQSLDERERYIIQEYFLADDEPKTLEMIGEDLELTKERVRQIRDKALRKIRNNSDLLFSFLK